MNPALFLVSCCCLRVPHTQLCFRKCASTVVTRIPSVPSRKVVHSWQGTRRLGFRMVSESSVSHNIVRARHILVETEAMADALLQQLRQGQDFSELANKVRGGELGWFRRNTMVAPFEDACFQAKPGELRKVQTEYGWHVIQVQGQAIEPGSITVEEFAKIYPHQIRNVQLIDVREQNELELAQLDHFIHLPLGEYEKWAEQVESGQLLDKEKETIVMCHHGIRSAQMCSYLAQQGFMKVRNLTGGIDAYAKQVDSTIGTY